MAALGKPVDISPDSHHEIIMDSCSDAIEHCHNVHTHCWFNFLYLRFLEVLLCFLSHLWEIGSMAPCAEWGKGLLPSCQQHGQNL